MLEVQINQISAQIQKKRTKMRGMCVREREGEREIERVREREKGRERERNKERVCAS